jgi:hypothetical protein
VPHLLGVHWTFLEISLHRALGARHGEDSRTESGHELRSGTMLHEKPRVQQLARSWVHDEGEESAADVRSDSGGLHKPKSRSQVAM